MVSFWRDRLEPLLTSVGKSTRSHFSYAKVNDLNGGSMPSLTRYEKVTVEEGEEEEAGNVSSDSSPFNSKSARLILQPPPSAWSSRILTICLFLNMTCLLVIMFMLSHHSSRSQSVSVPQSNPTGKEFGSCGENGDIAAARAAGCVFDPASLIWTKPECYDQDLVDSFLARTEWNFYTNKTLLPEYKIPYDEWLRGEHPIVYAPRKFHVVHCYYMWEKLHKAYLTGGPMDSEVAQLHHTRHCSKALLNDYLGEDTCAMGARCPTYAGTTWTSCGYYH